MKFLVIFALALATVSAFDLRNAEPKLEKEGRIANGENAENGQFPYQVGLDFEKEDGSTHVCGGSIISEEYVLTAAHCIEGSERVSVYFGTTSFTAIELEVSVEAENFIIHEEYDSETLLNDIGLIKVPALTYTDTIQPVALPAISDSYPSYVGDDAIAAGWGYTSDESGNTPDLQWASMKVIGNSESYGPDFPLSQICVSSEGGVSACDGDSGSPLVLADTNTQIGLMSFTTVSCTAGNPQSYTRLTSYLTWISNNTDIEL